MKKLKVPKKNSASGQNPCQKSSKKVLKTMPKLFQIDAKVGRRRPKAAAGRLLAAFGRVLAWFAGLFCGTFGIVFGQKVSLFGGLLVFSKTKSLGEFTPKFRHMLQLALIISYVSDRPPPWADTPQIRNCHSRCGPIQVEL